MKNVVLKGLDVCIFWTKKNEKWGRQGIHNIQMSFSNAMNKGGYRFLKSTQYQLSGVLPWI